MKFIQILFLLCYFFDDFQSAPVYDNKIRLIDIPSLRLYPGRMTTGRRKPPIPQLQCNMGCNYEPAYVDCFNRGSNGFTDVKVITWECIAPLPATLKFGVIKVTCEGYDSNMDPYVLVGSCGLIYNLESTNWMDRRKLGAVLGGVFGGLFLICASAFFICFCCACRKNSQGVTSTAGTPKAGAGSYFRFRPRMNRWGGHRSGGGGMHMSSGIGGTSLR